jgi:hypothetical protein
MMRQDYLMVVINVNSSGTYDFDGFDFGNKFKIKLLLNELK